MWSLHERKKKSPAFETPGTSRFGLVGPGINHPVKC